MERLKEMGYYKELIFSTRLDVYNLVSVLRIMSLNDAQKQSGSDNHRDLYDLFKSSKEKQDVYKRQPENKVNIVEHHIITIVF